MRHQVFIVWFIIFLLWSIYRVNFFRPEWIDELLVKPIIYVFPIIYIVRIKEKLKFKELGLISSLKDVFVDIFIGVIIGILFAFEGLYSNYVKYGRFSFLPLDTIKLSGGIIFFLLINLISSIWEEILGRGYIYQRLFKQSDRQFESALISSFLFLLLHIPIIFTRLHLMGVSLVIYIFSIIILGVTNCYLFSLRKSLVLPVLIHTFWNMTVALYL
ncbi:hypothetical protein A2Y99_04175 [Candidatus Gottesmanbacteria bacterium RBG_13_37_7]|uniref:CAAX prenyl protease 2/Lysostaphin resistance protein A-like domain-containing protein n=1 Tax=Candidatus Gottesmanbacteria bacterium RBG_13_37_7 TaxID=1798369 RepID=A0A1F5YKC2_9BACT|nr:MAG: hypothetical protein A2Y99_04175 [Candidatus Gottesmanbacteria bacterium RBG_13_37_7]